MSNQLKKIYPKNNPYRDSVIREMVSAFEEMINEKLGDMWQCYKETARQGDKRSQKILKRGFLTPKEQWADFNHFIGVSYEGTNISVTKTTGRTNDELSFVAGHPFEVLSTWLLLCPNNARSEIIARLGNAGP
jgi:hypothetical protein